MTTNNCQNCGVGFGPDDMFCENCGYDFITGSLPVDADGPVVSAPSPAKSSAAAAQPVGSSAAAPAGSAPVSVDPPSILNDEESGSASNGAAVGGDVPRLKLAVSVDRAFFEEVVNDGEIEFPDPLPVDQELDLAGAELHIGRTSESRAIHPDVDVAALTGDQAVSSRHAVLRVALDGSYTIVDVGSTNGTFLESVDSEAITHGVPMVVEAGTPVYVGAWTKLTIVEQA